MSVTKKQLIIDAYATIGFSDYFYNEDAEQINFALRILDRMLGNWESEGVNIGYNFDADVQAQSGIPQYAENAVVLNLCVMLANANGKQVPVDTKNDAIHAFSNMKLKFISIPELKRNTLMPRGQGARVYSTDLSNFITE